jgi:NCS1 family nucleobase:cation symporter-1
MFCPLFGVVLADYFLLRKGLLQTEDLYREGGAYWFTRGVNPVALLAWVVGFMMYMGFSAMLMEKVLGIKAALPWPMGSSLPSMIVAGVIYWALERHKRGMT